MERKRRKAPGIPEITEEPARHTTPAAGSAVQVIWGATAENFDLAGMTVADAYRLLSAPLNIAPAVAALVNGCTAEGEHRLGVGDVLEFARPAGEKGARP